MSVINREDTLSIFEGLVESRKKLSCQNKSALIEQKAFEYAIAIIKKIPDAKE